MHYLLGNLHDSEGASLESCLLAADLPNVHPQVSAAASVMTRAIFAVSVTKRLLSTQQRAAFGPSLLRSGPIALPWPVRRLPAAMILARTCLRSPWKSRAQPDKL